ncbi:Rieske (2Fe-2S) protein [Nesterenkonia flava]|uniref:Cytochrome bc1 complex Rieske iron-sulfur subunit n=1 Tax=Nesterenkonia flava TaxID=469799 RepID=A0ABU1FUV9_9MICC|nr:Rieske (2Fe-2S) protein [Nesterenkonia flava]MDR5712403.1 Rieske (2Fe-2S) protein [Nesterenkonia flava]
MSSSCCSRREILRTGAVAGASALVLTACGGSDEEVPAAEPAQWQDALVEGDVPVGESVRVAFGENKVLLHRATETQVYAYSAVCTHQGCTVNPEPERFICPCHSSVYDLESGEPVAGPAPRALERYEARVESGIIQVRI